MKRKTIAIDVDQHAEWSNLAQAEGLSLIEYVRRAVDAFPLAQEASKTSRGIMPAPMPAPTRTPMRGTPREYLDPKLCTNRLREGTWCRICGTTHRGTK